jgi:hypothetical protein
MSALYAVICNDCGALAKETSALYIRDARMRNKPHGWKNPRPGVDYCKECAEKHKPVASGHPGYF